MKWWRIFISILIVEVIALLIDNILTGSQPQEQLIFNLSLYRLLLTFALGLIILLLALILVRSYKDKNILNRIIFNDKYALALVIISFLLLNVVLFFLCKNPKGMGDFQQMYLHLKPFLVWSFAISLQTLFFSMVWFCHAFLGNAQHSDDKQYDNELFLLLLIFLGLVIVKLVLVVSTAYGPVIEGDEQHYFAMANYLYFGIFDIKEINNSPYLYPAMLSVAFYFNDKAYTIMKFLNVLYSSSILFPLYLIARKFFSRNKSLLVTLSACVLPYHLVFPRMLMSENLYFPIFLWMILFILNKPKNVDLHGLWQLLTGVSIGLLYLTRYITLATIPFVLFAWWYINRGGTGTEPNVHKPMQRYKNEFRMFIFLILGIVIGFGPWLVGGLIKGVPLRLLLGFGIASETTTSQLTLPNLLIWFVLYICYLILMAAPLLSCFALLVGTRIKDWNRDLRNWIVLTCALLAGFITACARHSWRALYNEAIPSRIMGRYVLYFTPLFVISAFLIMQQHFSLKRTSLPKHILQTGVIPFAVIALAYAVIFKNLFRLHDGDLIKILGSVDGAYYQYLGIYFLIIVFLITTATVWLSWKNQPERLLKINFILFIIFYLIGLPAYYQELLSNQDYQYLAKTIIDMYKSGDSHLQDTILILTPTDATARERALMDNTFNFNNYNDLQVTNIKNFSDENISKNDDIQNVVISKIDDSITSSNSSGKIIEFNHHRYRLNY